MTDLTQRRIDNFSSFAVNLRAFAARQEARAPGRMDHITGPAMQAAELAEKIAAAYAAGDKATADEARTAYSELTRINMLDHVAR